MANLPEVTIVIEWENAIDVEEKWTRKAILDLESELRASVEHFAKLPVVLYLYDSNRVSEQGIRSQIASAASDIASLCHLRIEPAPGLTYYQLKNRGAEIAETDIVVMLDSDAGPCPGWLRAILAPFADPEVKAVGGFTTLGHDDLLSRTMALSWIFDLPGERERTRKRRKIHANNCAFRTAFLRSHPFPDLPAFKKQCGFWLRHIDAIGMKWVRTPEARTIHAPHPGGAFIVWRAWTTGLDRDFQAFHTITRSRAGRIGYAFYFLVSKTARSWWRILTRRKEVQLPIWQVPAAMTIGVAFYGVAFAGELYSACGRSIEELPVGLSASGSASSAA